MGDMIEEETQFSKFNAGLLQMSRIHILQERINNCNLNPLAFNIDYQIYNYEVVVASLDSLLQEVFPKLKKDEKSDGAGLREALKIGLGKYPIYEMKVKIRSSSNQSVQLNKTNWEVMRKFIVKYETLVREFLEAHKLNSPPEDESALF